MNYAPSERDLIREAFQKLIDKIDLEKIADEWAGPDGSGHWSAGNAASSVLNMIYDERNKYRTEAPK